jgi:NADH-quinone oxidoreductase subunit M
MIQRAAAHAEIAQLGGLAKPLPVYAAFFLVVTLSSIGLPGLNGFVGEFLILLGAFKTHPWAASLSATGVISPRSTCLDGAAGLLRPCDRREPPFST